MATLKYIFIILEVLLLFNLLIGVHELGHFLAAKWRGLKIDRFAIWFGKPIWKKKIAGVEFALGWIPAGGYVALPQMAPMEAIEGKSEDAVEPLPNISALDKIIVAFAGPLFSFLLAIVFAIVVWTIGRPVNESAKTTTLGWVDQNGPAWKAGLRPGDKILEVDGHPVTDFQSQAQDSIKWRIITSQGTNIPVKYLRDGQEQMAYAELHYERTHWYERRALRQILIAPAMESIVGEVATNSPAAQAGLRRGDDILALNGEKIFSPTAVWQLENSMTNSTLKSVAFTIRRDGQEMEKKLTPEKPLLPAKSAPSFGIAAFVFNTNVTLAHPTPAQQISESAGQIFSTVAALLHRGNDIGLGQLGGPVMIVRVYSNLFDSENGWRQAIWFSVILNVNLALINMVPFPVLDGGHILLALLEVIRRRPVNARLLNYLQTSCALLLISFMLFTVFFDAGDWWRTSRRDHQDEQPIVFAPK
jgi:regulator of sigma E protease